MDHYNFIHKHGNKKNCEQQIKLYTFINDFNDVYIVEVFLYKHNVYAIKFFLKKHRLSQHRYNIVYPKSFGKKFNRITGNSNFLKVLNTIIEIALEISKSDPIASFGFMGAPKMTEMDPNKNAKNINADNTVCLTRRYKVYKNFVRRHYNPDDFEYIESDTSSIMLLRNNKNKTVLTKKKAEDFIVNEIIPTL